jgi:hypothetical protein
MMKLFRSFQENNIITANKKSLSSSDDIKKFKHPAQMDDCMVVPPYTAPVMKKNVISFMCAWHDRCGLNSGPRKNAIDACIGRVIGSMLMGETKRWHRACTDILDTSTDDPAWPDVECTGKVQAGDRCIRCLAPFGVKCPRCVRRYCEMHMRPIECGWCHQMGCEFCVTELECEKCGSDTNRCHRCYPYTQGTCKACHCDYCVDCWSEVVTYIDLYKPVKFLDYRVICKYCLNLGKDAIMCTNHRCGKRLDPESCSRKNRCGICGRVMCDDCRALCTASRECDNCFHLRNDKKNKKIVDYFHPY